MDIGQGAGLAGATGIRPFLPPLLAGALARADAGLDFDGTGWRFLESVPFMLGLLVLTVIWYGAERSGFDQRGLRVAGLAVALALGALLFAGSLVAGGSSAWLGAGAGLACAGLAYVAVGGLFERAARRLGGEQRGLLAVSADGAALLVAAVSILLPPAGYLAVAAFLLLILGSRREAGRKYAGLRILR